MKFFKLKRIGSIEEFIKLFLLVTLVVVVALIAWWLFKKALFVLAIVAPIALIIYFALWCADQWLYRNEDLPSAQTHNGHRD